MKYQVHCVFHCREIVSQYTETRKPPSECIVNLSIEHKCHCQFHCSEYLKRENNYFKYANLKGLTILCD